jgi:hypothetical protein
MYEIPQQLEYKEKIVFGLTFSQLFYAMIFLPVSFVFMFRLSGSIYVRGFLAMIPATIAAGFMFFDLSTRIKDYVIWWKNKNLEEEFKIKKFFDIKEIKDNFIFTEKKRLAVLKIEPINFDIKGEEEKKAIMFSFQKMLNSLDFPIQILMTTETLSLDDYLNSLFSRIQVSSSHIKDSKKIFADYSKHMRNIVQENSALNRSFYVIIPETSNIDIQLII